MSRPLTYLGALAILGKVDRPLLDKLDKLLGGIVLGGAALVGPASWALFDPKSESFAVTRSLLDQAKQRALGTAGHSRRELLAAAHTVLMVSSFFDAVAEAIGPGYELLEITDEEKLRFFGSSTPGERRLVDQLLDLQIPLPSVTTSDWFAHSAHSAHSATRFASLSSAVVAFISGLAVADRVLRGVDTEELARTIVLRAAENCWDAYLSFAADVPEFAIWLSWSHDQTNRVALESMRVDVREMLARQSVSLSKLHDLLTLTASGRQPGVRSYRERLAMANRAVMVEPLLRSGALDQAGGLVFPTVERGFVTPHFRAVRRTPDTRPAEESWWADMDQRTDLDEFLAAYLSSLDSTKLPLLILGHPGAGKSLLTEVLAARLPATGFTVVRVPLRRVDPTKPVHQQIGDAMELVLKERVDWGRFTEECHDTVRIVILDGLDELILATGVTQSTYLEQVANFQKDELDLGRPVTMIVTSRTLVADRARIPTGCLMVKLEEFDDDQIGTWLQSWNDVNATTAGFRPVTGEELRHHGELARQPLLLLILAMYAAEPDTGRFDSEDLSGAGLYRRLLDSFIRRQVRDKSARPLNPDEEDELAGNKRWRLSMAAFGMFNRGNQHIADDELELDIASFHPAARSGERATFGVPVSRAEQTMAEFFFVHVSQSKDESNRQRTYEFLHSTFGEYLIAEYTMLLLSQLANQLDSSVHGLPVREAPNDDQLFALLSHQPLVNRQRIVDFATDIVESFDEDRQRRLRRLLTDLLRRARSMARTRDYTQYEPTPYDSVCRLAAYTANLVTLRVMLDAVDVSPRMLAPANVDPMPWWRSLVHLWEAGLDGDGWESIRDSLSLTYGPDPVIMTEPSETRGRLLGLDAEELHTNIGADFVGYNATIQDEGERELYENLADTVLRSFGSFSSNRLLPVDEERFELVASAIANGSKLSYSASRTLWTALSRTSSQLPFDTVGRLVSLLLAGRESRGGKRWDKLGCELAAVMAAHPGLLLLDDVAAVVENSGFPDYLNDAHAAVTVLWLAERASQEPERGALRALRTRFDELIAGNPEELSPIWLDPGFLTYLRVERPSYWNIGDTVLEWLSRCPTFTLSRVAPVDALYVVTAHRPDPEPTDLESEVWNFVRAYLVAHGQPTDELTEDNAAETLARYAELPWSRP